MGELAATQNTRSSFQTHAKKRSGSFFGSFFRRKGSEVREAQGQEQNEAVDQDTPNIQYYKEPKGGHPLSPPRLSHGGKGLAVPKDERLASNQKRSAPRRYG